MPLNKVTTANSEQLQKPRWGEKSIFSSFLKTFNLEIFSNLKKCKTFLKENAHLPSGQIHFFFLTISPYLLSHSLSLFLIFFLNHLKVGYIAPLSIKQSTTSILLLSKNRSILLHSHSTVTNLSKVFINTFFIQSATSILSSISCLKYVFCPIFSSLQHRI